MRRVLWPLPGKSTFQAEKKMNNNNLSELEEKIEYHFKDRSLLELAVTHTSYANEHRRENIAHNERIEFLGDAVLETVSSEYLYLKYPELGEG